MDIGYLLVISCQFAIKNRCISRTRNKSGGVLFQNLSAAAKRHILMEFALRERKLLRWSALQPTKSEERQTRSSVRGDTQHRGETSSFAVHGIRESVRTKSPDMDRGIEQACNSLRDIRSSWIHGGSTDVETALAFSV